MEHYFTSKPNVEHDVKTFHVTLRGFSLQFETDAGVFSRNQIDFGSQLLIETMDIPNDPNANILDLGCGYGPVGITAAKLAPISRIWMADINERAVELVRTNAKLNGVYHVEVRVSDLYQSLGGTKFTRILSNPPIRAGKKVVHQIFEDARSHLSEDGELWIVIQKKQGAPSAKKKLEELFDEVDDMARDAGFRIFRARKAKE